MRSSHAYSFGPRRARDSRGSCRRRARKPTPREIVEVTATRLPQDPIEVPASVRSSTGTISERLQIRTLPDALPLTMGVTVAPGGDGGPAGSVPEMMGLREFDAFPAGRGRRVPWGGAYNTPALDDRPRERGPDRDPPRRGTECDVRSNVVRRGHPRHPPRARASTPTLRARVSRQLRFLQVGGYGALRPPESGSTRSAPATTRLATKDESAPATTVATCCTRGLTDVGQGSWCSDFDATLLGQEPDSPTSPRVGAELDDARADRLQSEPFRLEAWTLEAIAIQVTLGHHAPALGETGRRRSRSTGTRSERTREGLLACRISTSRRTWRAPTRFRSDSIDEYRPGCTSTPTTTGDPGGGVSLVAGVDQVFGQGEY